MKVEFQTSVVGNTPSESFRKGQVIDAKNLGPQANDFLNRKVVKPVQAEKKRTAVLGRGRRKAVTE